MAVAKMSTESFLPPIVNCSEIRNYEVARIWDTISGYLSQKLALHQAVHIPQLGTFVVVKELATGTNKDVVAVHRPVFHLTKAVAELLDLQCGPKDAAAHAHRQQLPYDEIASDNAVSLSMVQLCLARTLRRFRICVENRKNVALTWRDVGMLIVQGKDVKMKFYSHFLKRLNGTAKMLQALLKMPEMRDLVISDQDTAASQTSSGHIIVLPECKTETLPKMSLVRIDRRGHAEVTSGQGCRKDGGSGKREELAEQPFLRRARLSPRQLPTVTINTEVALKAESREPRGRLLPPIRERSLKAKEAKGKVMVNNRMLNFTARAAGETEKGKDKKKKKKIPAHLKKYMDEEAKRAKELAAEEKSRRKSLSARAKSAREKKAPKEQGHRTREQPSTTPPPVTKRRDSSPDLLQRMMGECVEDEEESPVLILQEDNDVPPKRSLSPGTQQTLREVVTCILGQVTRKRRGQRDQQRDLDDKLTCELAVLRWQRSGKGTGSSQQQLQEARPQTAPQAAPGKRRAGPAQPHLCTEEERRQLWDSLCKEHQEKVGAQVAPLEAWRGEQEPWCASLRR
ncbi:coiled-coil domain-containing protein 81-like [Heliangelus exortis]|uniref:coiled-coil domain-containing protein 81-like n=1 Tax=Heliangelus exortis TaxID=472823 RepID=UPI003A94571D